MKIPLVASAKVHRYLSDPRFKKEFDMPFKVDRSHDVPYVAGYSKDDRVVFIDRHYKKMMGAVDTEPYIFIHEKAEKALIDTFGLKYQVAHHIATHLERMTIDRDGINWDKYEKNEKFLRFMLDKPEKEKENEILKTVYECFESQFSPTQAIKLPEDDEHIDFREYRPAKRLLVDDDDDIDY